MVVLYYYDSTKEAFSDPQASYVNHLFPISIIFKKHWPNTEVGVLTCKAPANCYKPL